MDDGRAGAVGSAARRTATPVGRPEVAEAGAGRPAVPTGGVGARSAVPSIRREATGEALRVEPPELGSIGVALCLARSAPGVTDRGCACSVRSAGDTGCGCSAGDTGCGGVSACAPGSACSGARSAGRLWDGLFGCSCVAAGCGVGLPALRIGPGTILFVSRVADSGRPRLSVGAVSLSSPRWLAEPDGDRRGTEVRELDSAGAGRYSYWR